MQPAKNLLVELLLLGDGVLNGLLLGLNVLLVLLLLGLQLNGSEESTVTRDLCLEYLG